MTGWRGSMTGQERLLAACQGKAVDATPVWFMRQAGRCLSEYRQLREQYGILTIAKTPELCAQVTEMPVTAFGVDGAVIFADIMLPMEAMGVSFIIEPEVGPIIERPLRSRADLDRLRVPEAEESTPYVFEAIRLLRPRLAGRAALIGFSGAPFTLACYLVEGRPSRDFGQARSLMFREPVVWQGLMETLTEVVIRYLRAQAEAGAEVLQLFDSWLGVLGPTEYDRFVLPYSRRIFETLRPLGIPTIYFGTGTASLLELMASAGSDLVSVDWRVRLDDAWQRVGYDRGIQGNLDPAALLAPYEVAAVAAREVLREADGRDGHVFNLGHGVLPETEAGTLARLVELVHSESARLG